VDDGGGISAGEADSWKLPETRPQGRGLMGDIMPDGQFVATFRLPADVATEQACVVGEFNDWSPTAHPMERGEDGFTATIALAPGRTYRFRYLLDGERWQNDWAADEYVPNEFGGTDSVIDLTNVDGSGPDGEQPSTNGAARRTTRA
jgi:hypothetical protein